MENQTKLTYKLETEIFEACVVVSMCIKRKDGVYVHYDSSTQLLSIENTREQGLAKAISAAEDYFGISINRKLLEVA